jgi:hypothetical protein
MLTRRNGLLAVCKCRQFLAEVSKPAQHIILVRILGPSLPTVLKEWITTFEALLEERLGRSLKVGHAPKVCAVKIAKPNIHRAKLLLQHIVHIFAMFGRVREAAGIAQPWSMESVG